MQIQLGGVTYELAAGTFITKQPLIEYPQHLRTTGQQERGGQTLMSNWWIENFESGFNCDRIDLASDRMKTSFWDSTADTMQRGQITNPRLPVAVPMDATTHTSPYFTYEYAGTTWGLTAAFSTTSKRNKHTALVNVYKILQYTGAAWNYSTLALNSASFTAAKLPDYIGGLACMCYQGSVSGTPNVIVKALMPTLGDTLVTVSNSALGSDNPILWKWANSAQAVVMLSTIDDHLYCMSSGATYALFGYLGVAGVSTPLQNMKMFQGQDGYEGLFCYYKNKITCWENFYYNTAANAVESSEIPYLDLFGLDDAANMNRISVFNGSMVFQVQDALLAYSADGSVMDIGMNMFSGMPSNKQGQIEDTVSSVRYLYALVNQTGIRQVFQFDGIGWHWFGKTPTMGNTATSFGWLHMLKTPAGVPQLMVTVEGDATAYSWNYPDTNPIYLPVGGTISWVATSHVITPEFDGGLPNQTGVAYKLSVEGDFDANRKATLYYSTIGAATGWVALGQATQSGRTAFDFGTLGIPHDIIQFQFGLEGYATGTPIIRTAVLDYLKFPEVRDVYTMTVDLVKTHAGNLASVQTSLDTLASVRDSYPMVPFQYGTNATVNIKILEIPAKEEYVTSTDGVYATTGAAALVTMRAVRLI